MRRRRKIGRPVKRRDLKVGLVVNLNATAIATGGGEFDTFPTTRHLVVDRYSKIRRIGWIVSLSHPDHPKWHAKAINIDYLEVA